MNHLEERDELLRIDRPVDVVYEAGAIADLLVKNNGPAVFLNSHAWPTVPFRPFRFS